MTDEERKMYEEASFYWKKSSKVDLPVYFDGDFSSRIKWVNQQLPEGYSLTWHSSTDGHTLYFQLCKNIGAPLGSYKEETK